MSLRLSIFSPLSEILNVQLSLGRGAAMVFRWSAFSRSLVHVCRHQKRGRRRHPAYIRARLGASDRPRARLFWPYTTGVQSKYR
jgi:hypothetical protein